MACFMMVGSYYCFDIPAALKTQIDDYFGDPSDYEFNFSLLYTLYAAPNARLYPIQWHYFTLERISNKDINFLRLFYLCLEGTLSTRLVFG